MSVFIYCKKLSHEAFKFCQSSIFCLSVFCNVPKTYFHIKHTTYLCYCYLNSYFYIYANLVFVCECCFSLCNNQQERRVGENLWSCASNKSPFRSNTVSFIYTLELILCTCFVLFSLFVCVRVKDLFEN